MLDNYNSLKSPRSLHATQLQGCQADTSHFAGHDATLRRCDWVAWRDCRRLDRGDHENTHKYYILGMPNKL
ncbi:hypothetical protein Y032_0375g235 [Ancylostoma ceylanicum]|uniref:Uncharacterized protein n=1 Tax=Ancylostoma ceylanicum TaxID=53326 RepID=A0A016RTU2_9BILA|nr:hypothetical protein Y032_0375g235 [Ancylostoma ceylanicum]